jgi:hypothetical protein
MNTRYLTEHVHRRPAHVALLPVVRSGGPAPDGWAAGWTPAGVPTWRLSRGGAPEL